MNNIKNAIVIVIMSILIVFSIGAISYYTEAEESRITDNNYNIDKIKMNSKFKYNLTDLAAGRKRGNLFCVEHKQSMSQWKDVNYKVANIISINGKKATALKKDGTTKDRISDWNAKLAAAIYYSKAGEAGDYNTNQRQKAIWYYLYNWVDNIGEDFYNIDKSIVGSNNEGLSKSVKNRVNRYVKKLNNEEDNGADAYIKDNSETIEYKAIVGSYIKIGYFNLEFEPDLESITVKGKTTSNASEHTISGIKFSQNNDSIDNASDIDSETDFSILIPVSAGVTEITEITFKTEETDGTSGVITAKVVILETESTNSSWQNLCFVKSYKDNTEPTSANITKKINLKLSGNLKITKVDQDNNNIKLEGAGFKLQNVATGQWVHQDSNHVITFTDYQNIATPFYTGIDGTRTIENLPLGKYKLYETQAPDNYEIVGPNPVEVTINGGSTTYKSVKNKQKYVDISGYVWNDNVSGKSSTNDGLYTGNDDKLLKGVKVTLMRWRKDANGTIYYNPNTDMEEVATTWTNDKGEYEFTKVLIEDLGRTFIVFEYNGMKYQSIKAQYDKDNGSKAVEHSWRNRATFNSQYNTISADVNRNTSVVNNKYNERINYNLENHTAKVIGIDDNYSEKFKITAETNFGNEHKKDAYYLNNEWTPGKQSIDNINLGLQIREQPDLALVKDIYDIRATINDYDYTYPYNQRFLNQAEYGNGFDNSVKYSDKYSSMGYTRAVYESDYKFENENDRSKELQLYVTYKIAIKNQSTTLTSKVNSIVDYYDNRYTLVGVGTSSEVDKTTRTYYIQH